MAKRILVVDDCEAVRMEVADLLRLEGFDVAAVENGADALNAVLAHRPDLIVCDVMMPRLDGFAALKVLRANAQTAKIPFIFVTAKDAAEHQQRGMTLGADVYIAKPFHVEQLLDAVRSQLGGGV